MTFDRLLDKWLGGHVTRGNVTIYGRNAMRWAVNIWSRTLEMWVCFRLPFTCWGKWWPLYFYISEDATPDSAIFILGRDE